MQKKDTAFACESSCGQKVNSKKASIEADEKNWFSNSDSYFPYLNRRLIMYKYLLSQLPLDWSEKHGEEIESLGFSFYMADLIAEAIRSDVEIERPFDLEKYHSTIAEKRGLSLVNWDGDMYEKAQEKAAIEILRREYGDILDPLIEGKRDHLG